MNPPVIQHQSIADDAEVRQGVEHQVMPTPAQMAKMEKVADEVKHDLSDLIRDDLVNVNKTDKGVEIEVKSSLLFGSGDADLGLKAVGVLRKIAEILKRNTADINVEGFTDDVPINTPRFPSNWELSTARASSVVRLFSRLGIESERLKAIGFAEFRPIAPNTTEIGRNKNRRVTIVVLNVVSDRRQRILDKEAENAQAITNAATVFGRAVGNRSAPAAESEPPKPTQPIQRPVPTMIQPILGLPISLPPPKPLGETPAPEAKPNPLSSKREPIRFGAPTLLQGGKESGP
jgi:outer membrane protein OmpA-like peptidoglycan-associated protein